MNEGERIVRKKGGGWAGMILPIAILVLVVGGGASAVIWSSIDASRYEAASDAFLEALRDGDFQRAYGQLSKRRRAAMSLGAFQELAQHRALRQNKRHSANSLRKIGGIGSRKACVRSRLELEDNDWHVQLYLVKDDDDVWHVESFALQEISPVVLSDLVEECFKGDPRIGYSGPPIVNATPRL